MKEHKLFLQQVLEDQQQPDDGSQVLLTQASWVMGDQNLAGVAPGPSAAPLQGSPGLRLADYFTTLQQQRGMRTLRLSATRRGGAAIDMHIC